MNGQRATLAFPPRRGPPRSAFPPFSCFKLSSQPLFSRLSVSVAGDSRQRETLDKPRPVCSLGGFLRKVASSSPLLPDHNHRLVLSASSSFEVCADQAKCRRKWHKRKRRILKVLACFFPPSLQVVLLRHRNDGAASSPSRRAQEEDGRLSLAARTAS